MYIRNVALDEFLSKIIFCLRFLKELFVNKIKKIKLRTVLSQAPNKNLRCPLESSLATTIETT